MSRQDFMDSYDEAAERLRAETEAKKTPADRIRDRLQYAENLRKSAAAARRVVDALNWWMQRPHSGERPPELRWSPWRHAIVFLFGPHKIILTTEEVEGIFSWLYQRDVDLRAHADRIEAEVAEGRSRS